MALTYVLGPPTNRPLIAQLGVQPRLTPLGVCPARFFTGHFKTSSNQSIVQSSLKTHVEKLDCW